MPFVEIRLTGAATREQKAAVVSDVTRSLAERMGKNPDKVTVNIIELSNENWGSGGILIADRASPAVAPPAQGDASADGKR